MKVLLDEGVPRQLVRALRAYGLEAFAFEKEWRGASNGELLALAEAAGYAILLTCDKNLRFQQSLRGRSLAVVTLPTTRKHVLMERVADIADTMARVAPGQHATIEPNGERLLSWEVEAENSEQKLPPVAPFAI